MSTFRIYYGDGGTYSGDPYFAPATNVQVIAQHDAAEPGFVLLHGDREKGFYFWDGSQWRLCDTAGFWDHMMLARGPKAVLFGRTIRDEDYWRIVSRASREGVNGG